MTLSLKIFHQLYIKKIHHPMGYKFIQNTNLQANQANQKWCANSELKTPIARFHFKVE